MIHWPAVKIYTRTGDDGSTGLLGPERVPKSDPRIEACGAVDELNAALGVTGTLDDRGWFTDEFRGFQPALFEIGAALAAAGPRAPVARGVTDDDVAKLEATIDALESALPALTRFILPGGTPLAAQLHVARTVCRRAERRVVALGVEGEARARIVRYLNRLGDLLFVMARTSNRRAGTAEIEWLPEPPGAEAGGTR